MFERFTESARRAVAQGHVKARELQHNYIGTEHLLLGLLDDIDETMARRLLVDAGVTYERVAEAVKRIVGQGDDPRQGNLPFTPRAKRILELALREALSQGCNYIGTEHLLLALLREGEGVAARILTDLDVNHGKVIARWFELVGRTADPVTVDPEHEDRLENVVAAQDHVITEMRRLTDRLERLRRREQELRSG